MSVLQALTVPKWGMSMEDGEILAWHAQVGDQLQAGDDLVDIETSKIVNTAQCPGAGRLVRIVAEAGTTLEVGQLMGVLARGEASEAEIDAFIEAFVPDASAAARSQSSAAAERDAGPVEVATAPVEVAAAPGAGSATATSGDLAGGPDDSQVKASVVARRLARRFNINLNNVPATGRHGRVSKADVERAALGAPGASGFREEKLSGMRRTIAARLSESKQTIPHFRVSLDIEIDNLLRQRRHMNEVLGHRFSVNDFVLKACAGALVQVPQVNVQYTGHSLRFLEQVDICVAVAVEGGLVTPVIRDVANKSLPQISAEARDLAGRARAGGLTVDDLTGGTFSVSNLGMLGVDEFDAIINPPQAAILAVAAGRKQPVARDDGLAVATVMRVSLSSDHRAIDGAVAARFLQALKGLLENPGSMML